MNRAVIQVPVDPQLKKRAEKRAESDGFSSLQQLIRLVLAKYDSGRLEIGVRQIEPIKLSPKAARRYKRIEEDYKRGKNIRTAYSVDELMRQLNED